MKLNRLIIRTLTIIFILNIFIGSAFQVNARETEVNIIELKSGFDNLNTSYDDNETLRILESRAVVLDPHEAIYSSPNLVLSNISEGLVTYDVNKRIVGGVAESYSLSRDRLTYTFYLRKNAKWNDGTPVTAHDFVYSWQRLSQTGTYRDYLLGTAQIKNYEAILEGTASKEDLGVKALDDHTLVVELEQPVSYLLSLMTLPSFAPIREDMVIAANGNYGKNFDYLAYNGPYMVKSWYSYDHFLLTKNPHYWGNQHIDIENIKVITSEPDGYESFLNNEIDVAEILYEQSINASKYGLTATKTNNGSIFYLNFNQKDALLKNSNARKAIVYGLDSSYIPQIKQSWISANYYIPSSFFKDSNGFDFRRPHNEFLLYNKDLALEYWNTAKSQLGIQSYTMELLTFDSNLSQAIAEYIKEELEQNLPGLTVKIVPVTFTEKLDLQSRGKYSSSFSGWGMDYNDPLAYLEVYTSTSVNNDVNYSSSFYDTLIKLASSSSILSEDIRLRLLKMAEKELLLKDAVIKPLYETGDYYLVKDNVKNLIHDYGINQSIKFVIIE
ncbi:peptide ABC transporter substrate-binding protein [Vallitalea okinawensis]|uniref:peptide ABC transporter substrate-binding protein n=1 Tax=Vallitalea okinawensis TaxID=2078660 RepID=UPI000CFA9B4F|nr:peptide ABC transporter substrate-binding protein [Vallitalea okinawensis]